MGYTSINVTIIVDYVGKIHSVEEKKAHSCPLLDQW